MPCYKPLKGWLSKTGGITFDISQAYRDVQKEVACGKCIGCRLERSRVWAVRCVHEAQMHDENCFLTLTYNDANLPIDGSLNKDHFQRFLKRLRKQISPKKISFFHCGEYGDNLGRPHYHALIFGHNFDDRKHHKKSKSGHSLYTSEELDRLWTYGHCYIGELNFETAAYTARYCLKKITGDSAAAHYDGKQPEYCTMSTKPAIGKRWADRYASTDAYRRDEVILNGVPMKPPRYYDKLLKRGDPATYALTKELRQPGWQIRKQGVVPKVQPSALKEKLFNQTKARLAVREQVTTLNTNRIKRNLNED